MFKQIVVGAVLVLSAHTAALAQSGTEQGRQELARQVVESSLPGAADAMALGMRDGLAEINLTPDQREQLIALVVDAWQEGESAFKADMVDFYAGNFSEAELRDLLGFYATGTGVKLLQLTPQLAHESQKSVARHITPLMEARVREFLTAVFEDQSQE